MAEDRSYQAGEIANFRQCREKLLLLVYKEGHEFATELNLLLDQLNSLEYSIKLAQDEELIQVLNRCCTIVPVRYERMVTKFCQLIVNITNRQHVDLPQASLDLLLEYLESSLHSCPAWTYPDILPALGAVLYENGGRLEKFLPTLLGEQGFLVQFTDVSVPDEEIRRVALQCVENMCLKSSYHPPLPEAYLSVCFNIFLKNLQNSKSAKMDDITYCRLVVSALRGIQNVLLQSKTVHLEYIGNLLGVLKYFLFYGMPSHSSVTLAALYPTPMSQFDPSSPVSTLKLQTADSGKGEPNTGAKAQTKKGKKKKSKTKKEVTQETDTIQSATERLSTVDLQSPSRNINLSSSQNSNSLRPEWNRISSSESEFSDTEGGQASKLRSFQARVRQNSLGALHGVIKVSEKRVLFGYWSGFIPDTAGTSGQQTHTLFTTILKDPIPKCRTGALAVLGGLLEGSKQYLAAADDSEQHKAAFTSFSATLGTMIKEIHRCLLLALSSEPAPLTITQTIKCLATLIPNVPYHKLKPGLLSRVVKHVRPFLTHRDPNIRVACLTCLGSVATVQAPLMEVCHILLPARPQIIKIRESLSDTQQPENVTGSSAYLTENQASGGSTPNALSGSQTPTFSEQSLQKQITEISWVVKHCAKNAVPMNTDVILSASSSSVKSHTEPLPVRLESLQVLAQLVRGYFTVIRASLQLLCDVIHSCLQDKDPAVQLHGAKVLEELGSALLRKLQDSPDSGQVTVDLTEASEIWTKLLRGPLPQALQNTDHHALRATACDCLSNIGDMVFDKLARNEALLCMTLLLGLTNDEDRHVKAAAVRALGVYVLYSCLREDVSFVADAANVMLTLMDDSSLIVRMKAAWSLGNLSDALVINKDAGDDNFIEDFSDMLLLKLLTVTVKGCQDNDKVKSNAVRAVGNLLRYAPSRSLGKSSFTALVNQGVAALVKTATAGAVKVRWNACYAVGNMLKNPILASAHEDWTETVYGALCSVVKDCKNFKVCINAALALAVPIERHRYGSPTQFTSVWDSLCMALEKTENVTDFAEYKHRESLVEQVCHTLSHVAGLTSCEDLTLLNDVLYHRVDPLVEYMEKYRLSLDGSGDKVAVLANASAHIISLSQQTLPKAQLSTVQMMQDIFVQKSEDDKEESKSAFVQAYD